MKKIIRWMVRTVPRPMLIKLSLIFYKPVSFFYSGNNVACPVCQNTYRKFLPYGNAGKENRLCPGCLSLERHRLLWMYLQKQTRFFIDKYKVLHIAPEQPYIKRFRTLINLDYTTADLFSPLADVKTDIRNMCFADNTFDVLICNHVMEHIDDEQAAFAEIHRVLKPGGWAILQVPIDYSLEKTYEDTAIVSEADREKHFGQYDHIRLYGRDYAQRISKSGLVVDENNFIKTFSSEEINKYRLDKEEVIYICKKE